MHLTNAPNEDCLMRSQDRHMLDFWKRPPQEATYNHSISVFGWLLLQVVGKIRVLSRFAESPMLKGCSVICRISYVWKRPPQAATCNHLISILCWLLLQVVGKIRVWSRFAESPRFHFSVWSVSAGYKVVFGRCWWYLPGEQSIHVNQTCITCKRAILLHTSNEVVEFITETIIWTFALSTAHVSTVFEDSNCA